MCCQMLLLKYVTIFIVTWNIGCGGDFNKLLVEEVNENTNPAGMAISFIIKNIRATDIRIFGTESFILHNYTNLAMNFKPITLMLHNVERQLQRTKKYPITTVVVLFLDKYVQQFPSNITDLWRKISWNRMILIADNCLEFRSIVEYFALIWSKNVLNFIFLNNCNGTVDAHIYFPFANNHCRKFAAANIVKLGSFHKEPSTNEIEFRLEYRLRSEEFRKNSRNSSPFFPGKIPLNLNRCPVYVSTGIWPPNVINISSVDEAGIEFEFIKTLENKMNCNLSVYVDDLQDMGLKFGENEEPTGRMGRLKSEHYDLLFGAVPAAVNVFKDFDTTDCFLPNVLTFIVPTAGVFPSSMILWTVIEKNKNLFCIIVGAVVVLSIVINYMVKLSDNSNLSVKRDRYSSRYFILKTFTSLLRSLIETSTPTLPDNKIIHWVFGLWFGACLIFSCYFNTTLTSFFTEPGHTEQIKTVQDIIYSRIPIHVDELYKPVMMADSTSDHAKYFNSKNVKSSVPVGLKLASMGLSATFTDVLRARHISVQWVSSYGESSIYYVAGPNTLRYWNVLIGFKGNPIMGRVNDIMRRINQAGFWDFQIHRYYNRRLIRTMVRQYLIVYNFQHGINNTKSINQFNEGFSDSMSLVGGENGTGKLLLETDEEDIIRRFVRSEKTLVTWDHLSTVFRLWSIGMVLGGLLFSCEILIFRMKLKYSY